MSIERITTPTFDTFIHTNKYVVIDFYADWCGPCKMMSPIMDKISEEFKNKNIHFGKLNVDLDASIAKRYGISSIPTIILFDQGKIINQFSGYRPESEVKKFIINSINK